METGPRADSGGTVFGLQLVIAGSIGAGFFMAQCESLGTAGDQRWAGDRMSIRKRAPANLTMASASVGLLRP